MVFMRQSSISVGGEVDTSLPLAVLGHGGVPAVTKPWRRRQSEKRETPFCASAGMRSVAFSDGAA